MWKVKNLGEKMCHNLATAAAKEKFRLEPDEQAVVDAWLDVKYPERVKKDPPDQSNAPLFDVPTVQ